MNRPMAALSFMTAAFLAAASVSQAAQVVDTLRAANRDVARTLEKAGCKESPILALSPNSVHAARSDQCLTRSGGRDAGAANRSRSMKRAAVTLSGSLLATFALAQTPPQAAGALDLNLPAATRVHSPDTDAKAAEVPGVYYGDVGGNGDAASNTVVSGTVGTTVGYAKGFGSGISTAADFNMSTQTGSGHTLDLNIGVMRSNGFPGGGWGYGYGRGPGPH